MYAQLIHRLGALLKWAATRLVAYRRPSGIWIDVGAHLGEMSFSFAQENPCLTVYAFEPNLELAMQLMGRLPNYVVIPMAVAKHNGCTDFYINTVDHASSILPFDPQGHKQWLGAEELEVQSKATVAATRLDTFMNLMAISRVDFLKIDAQGADFEVVKSAGQRLKDIEKIMLEVAVTQIPLYAGAASKDEVVQYLEKMGFVLVECRRQTHDQEENLVFVRA